jgi:hypothetical protein
MAVITAIIAISGKLKVPCNFGTNIKPRVIAARIGKSLPSIIFLDKTKTNPPEIIKAMIIPAEGTKLFKAITNNVPSNPVKAALAKISLREKREVFLITGEGVGDGGIGEGGGDEGIGEGGGDGVIGGGGRGGFKAVKTSSLD